MKVPSFILFIFFPCSLFAQLKWVNVDSLYQPLPPTIHVYYSNDSINGKPNIAYYVEALVKDKTLDFTTQIGKGKRFTPTEYFAKEDSPIVVVNCTFFEFKHNSNVNLVVQNKKLVAYNLTSIKDKGNDYKYISRSAFGIDKKRNLNIAYTYTDSSKKWPYSFENPIVYKGNLAVAAINDVAFNNNKPLPYKKWKMQTAFGGGPRLLKDGAIQISNNEEHLFIGKGIDDKHPRTAMGYTADGKIIILVVQGRFPKKAEGASLTEEATMLRDLGCTNALNLDGGGSSCLLVNGKPTIQVSDKEGQRPVPAVFLIKAIKK